MTINLNDLSVILQSNSKGYYLKQSSNITSNSIQPILGAHGLQLNEPREEQQTMIIQGQPKKSLTEFML